MSMPAPLPHPCLLIYAKPVPDTGREERQRDIKGGRQSVCVSGCVRVRCSKSKGGTYSKKALSVC